MMYSSFVAEFVKIAYGEKGHKILQNAQNSALGAGEHYGRLAHEGNLMTDGGVAQKSVLRRVRDKVAPRSKILGKAVDGLARIADKTDVITSPFMPTNSPYHNMGVSQGATPYGSTQKVIRQGKDTAIKGLADSAERVSNPKKGLRGVLRKVRGDMQLTDSAINFGREAGHVHQDYMPHAKRITQVVNDPNLPTIDKAIHRASKVVPAENIRRTVESGAAHRNLVNREFIDGEKGVSKGEIRNAANRGKQINAKAVNELVARGYTKDQAKKMVDRVLHHKPGALGEVLGKAKGQGRVLWRHAKSLLRR
jgi:hypothetical protein